jgi:pyruvate dehydrogenase E2 component (dihydrolipoamide acetyltransferase)
MRAAIAAAMSRSKREIPHFYVGLTIDLEPLLDWLGERNAARPVTERVLPAACLLAAAARAARAVPELNGRWQGAGPELAERVDLAVIVAGRGGAGGLYAPVIADVAELSLDELMTRFRDIVQRARAGRLRSSELGAGTIAISSLGDRAGDWILPVIQPPQLAIIGFGAIVERPWVGEGAVVPRHVAVATLAADHRAADGRRAAALLEQLAAALAAPATLEVPAAGKR